MKPQLRSEETVISWEATLCSLTFTLSFMSFLHLKILLLFLLSAFFLYFSSKKISCFSLRQNTKLITLPLGLCSYPVTSYTYLYYLTSHAVLDVCLFVYKYYLSLSKIGSVSYSALYAEYMPSQCNLHGE